MFCHRFLKGDLFVASKEVLVACKLPKGFSPLAANLLVRSYDLNFIDDALRCPSANSSQPHRGIPA